MRPSQKKAESAASLRRYLGVPAVAVLGACMAGCVDYGYREPAYDLQVKPGTVMYEIAGVSEEVARTALLRVAHKMPVKTRFVYRRHSL